MSYYRMHRGWMDNPVFGKSAFSEREAWCWLIETAAWKPRQYRIGSGIIDLERGQLCASIRYIADAWAWKKDKTRRYLLTLQSARMIVIKSATAARQSEGVITICNYDIYQSECDRDATQSATATRQQRDSGATETRQRRDKTEEVEEVKEIKNTPPIVPPLAKSEQEAAKRDYAFSGRVIRLTQADFDAWKSAYHAIDLRAALMKVDAWLSNKGETDNWFFRASKWLENDHQRAVQARNALDPSASTIDTLSAVLGASNRQTAIDLVNAAKSEEKALAVIEEARQSDDPLMFVLRWIGRQHTKTPELFLHMDARYRPVTPAVF